jgi:hypothetical protein
MVNGATKLRLSKWMDNAAMNEMKECLDELRRWEHYTKQERRK